MYAHKIEFSFQNATTNQTLADISGGFLGALRMNGQINGAEWPIFFENDTYVAIVLAPEDRSLNAQFYGIYLRKQLSEIQTMGITVTTRVISEDATSASACCCNNPSGYILFTTFLSLESPIRCLDCFQPVPLYRFPVMPSGEYYEVICWQSDYQSCDRLQMNCTVLERAATRQISDVASSLSQAGKKNSKTLADLSGKPFYYYLYRGRGKNVLSEKKRLCPLCGEPWYLENPLHSLFHFRCDRCHLLSNFAWNLRDNKEQPLTDKRTA